MAVQRLGFFSYVDTKVDQPYAQALALFAHAETLGFDTAWVAQQHFGLVGGTPSPLVFLTALAERTTRINVGTAALSVSLDHGLRIAEDAATLEALHPGRLQLGLGTGHGLDDWYGLLGRKYENRRRYYQENTELIWDALHGRQLVGSGYSLYPPAGTLQERVWEAPSTPDGARLAGQRGSGLLLARVGLGAALTDSADIQRPLAEAYQDAAGHAGHTPRIGLSRTVLVGDDEEEASFASYRQEVIDSYINVYARDIDLHTVPDAELLRLANAHIGDVHTVTQSLLAEPLLEDITDLIIQTHPTTAHRGVIEQSLVRFVDSVAPTLGWQPSLTAAP